MTAAAPKSPDPNKEPNDDFQDRSSIGAANRNGRFLTALLSSVLVLLLLGGSGFWYLIGLRSPVGDQSGDRPIAAATAFVPANSPFTLSLLTRPDRLMTLQQAISAQGNNEAEAAPASRSGQTVQNPLRALSAIDKATGLDYEQDIQPWLGEEATFALTDVDLDRNIENGQQAGYLFALEVAPNQAQQARDFLQLFWQRQSLLGQLPISEAISGVRILSRDASVASQTGSQINRRPKAALAASALVGDRFVLLANDVRVLRRSIQSRQTATNLAQSRAYRQTVESLPDRRVALAYFDTTYLKPAETSSQAAPAFAAVSLDLTQAGVLATARKATTQLASLPIAPIGSDLTALAAADLQPVRALRFLPASSKLAFVGQRFPQLKDSIDDLRLPSTALPDFFQLEQTAEDTMLPAWDLWRWGKGDYALGRANTGSDDWILAIARSDQGIAQLDEAAQAKGYSIVPVAIGEDEAIAWTRFKARTSRSRTANQLETEILGLHLQQGAYEVFASTFAALEQAIASPQGALLESPRFVEAIAATNPGQSDYLYADWKALEPLLTSSIPAIKQAKEAVRPWLSDWLSSLETIAATRDADTARVLLQSVRSQS